MSLQSEKFSETDKYLPLKVDHSSGASTLMIVLGVVLLVAGFLSFMLASEEHGLESDQSIIRAFQCFISAIFVFAFAVALQKLHVIEMHVKDIRERQR